CAKGEEYCFSGGCYDNRFDVW
nr:immunoglobulin heavy chain junction region [Macaca mulatta]MOW45607.1 immunoglobulin heavy chain junction region [Macaca mulatta]MOW45619.1 immunoglobulin heavy chain junction region [Macaca mulatta]MOW45628.1 immunoglobulin heavy chain junction region [Macaca mulatta]MOW45663.1 immunoglobulin heavy chain junction region [Macaca mulatta]